MHLLHYLSASTNFNSDLHSQAYVVNKTLRSDDGDGDENHFISLPFSFRLCEEILYEKKLPKPNILAEIAASTIKQRRQSIRTESA